MTDTDPPKSDPARMMRLLWRESMPVRSKPGRKPSLAIDAFIDAAIEIADQDGLPALTIRNLALRLRKPTMAVYTFVSSREELVPLMLDTIHGRMRRARPASSNWKDCVKAVAEDNRSLFRQHVWAADVSFARPALGPGTMAKYEHELNALEGLGLDDVTTDDVLTHILVVVSSLARAEANQRSPGGAIAMSDEGWWAANAPFFTLAFDPEKFPLAARIGSAAGQVRGGAFDPSYAWDFAVDRLIDGLEGLVAGSSR